MATIKSYTDLQQSKKLADILTLESADHFHIIGHLHTDGPRYEVIRPRNEVVETDKYWPCWSLAALLNILPKIHGLKPILDLEECSIQYSGIDFYITASNPVDACVEMIIKLKEKNLL